MPRNSLLWASSGALVLALVFWGGCRVERSRWQAEQQKTQRWIDSTSKTFALDTLRLAFQIASLTKEAALLANARDSSLAAANESAALARVSQQKVARSRAALAQAETLRDSVTVQAEIITDQDTLLNEQKDEITKLRHSISSAVQHSATLQQAIDTLNGTLRHRDARIASLDSALRVAASTPPTKWFGITLSPAVTYVAGFVSGAASVAALYVFTRRP